jgi:hypothetical protein
MDFEGYFCLNLVYCPSYTSYFSERYFTIINNSKLLSVYCSLSFVFCLLDFDLTCFWLFSFNMFDFFNQYESYFYVKAHIPNNKIYAPLTSHLLSSLCRSARMKPQIVLLEIAFTSLSFVVSRKHFLTFYKSSSHFP